jgi:superfamily II DNA or RNA helicase
MKSMATDQTLPIAALRSRATVTRYRSGVDYFQKKLVKLKSKLAQRYSFTVQGSQAYEVSIAWSMKQNQGLLEVTCTCPDSKDKMEICKHIIASTYHLLELREEFYLWQRCLDVVQVKHVDPYDVGKNQPDATKLKKNLERTLRLRNIQHALAESKTKNLSFIFAGANPQPTIEVWYELQGRFPGDARWPAVKLVRSTAGDLTKPDLRLKTLSIKPDETGVRSIAYDNKDDFDLVYNLAAANNPIFYTADNWTNVSKTDLFSLPRRRCSDFLRKIIATRRGLFVAPQPGGKEAQEKSVGLFESSAGRWTTRFWLAPSADQNLWDLKAAFCQTDGQRRIDLNAVAYITRPGLAVLHTGEVIFFDESAAAVNLFLLEISRAPIQGTLDELKQIIIKLMCSVPQTDLDMEQSFAEYAVSPPLRPKISLLRSGEFDDGDVIPVIVSMSYGERDFSPFDPNLGWHEELKESERIQIYHRDLTAEGHWLKATQRTCSELRFEKNSPPHFNAVLERTKVVSVVLKAMELGWAVELQGKKVNAVKDFDIKVSSGIDWFDVSVKANIGGSPLSDHDLVRILRGRQRFTTLADGTWALDSSEKLRRNAAILEQFALDNCLGAFRIPRLHALLLDLEEDRQGQVKFDGGIEAFLSAIKTLQTPTPATPGPEFKGTLRPYQALGLGWLRALRDTQIGGCLADDMGLGKTIQVLAHIGEHYAARAAKALPLDQDQTKTKRQQTSTQAGNTEPMRPSLLVVPRSLVFNWQREAQKFVPHLRINELNNATKTSIFSLIKKSDVIVATFAMTRTQLETLKDIEFEYLILDEAQNIKNASSLIARSVKLLKAKHRLALSGTPVENHLSDLSSIFEFLNPGLCAAKGFHQSFEKLGQTPEGQHMLRRLLNPFILRRTKTEVLKDLPAKTESILYCDLGDEERRFYDKLAESVRANLVDEIKTVGIAKAQIHILSALTRLRQAACDRRLIEPKKPLAVGTKLDLLADRIKELTDDGQKTVVFSQFTEFLGLAKHRLEQEKISYCYLDGKTKDRQREVDRFNEDPGVTVFFVSLKSGGVGLNLTSASHCFLLDPWWNPAAEAQAIARLHRIGQRRPVFAYRLIGRGTVEEKILQLQDLKRGLAEAIINGQGAGDFAGENSAEGGANDGRTATPADAGPRGITIKDLELLLG